MTTFLQRETLRVCLVANSRFPIGEPFTGGLESMTWHLARELLRRGLLCAGVDRYRLVAVLVGFAD